jgi:hypothetical protein
MKASFGVVVALAVALGVMGAIPSIASAQTDPRIGSWKLNFEKTKFDPNSTRVKSDTRTYEADGDGVKGTIKRVPATGDPDRPPATFTAKYDGKDYPFIGNLDFDTIAIKTVDASGAQEITLKQGGKVKQSQRVVFSQGGQVMTIPTKGMNPSGQPLTNVLVFDKQ